MTYDNPHIWATITVMPGDSVSVGLRKLQRSLSERVPQGWKFLELPLPKGVEDADRVTRDGIPFRVIDTYDAVRNLNVTKIDAFAELPQ